MNEFNLEEFEESLGLTYKKNLQPYDYERYRRFNPQLSENMYKFLRDNKAEWKILCGVKTKINWSIDILDEVWYLNLNGRYKENYIYRNRYYPERYLALTTW